MSPVTIRTFIRENAYRDFWMFAVTIIAVVAVFKVQDAVDQINMERTRNIRANCEQVNERNRQTVRTLDQVLERRRRNATAEQRRELERSRVNTVLLINALAPVRDCDRLVAKRIESQ